MNRRECFLIAACATLAGPLGLQAQPTERIRRIGFLGNSSPLVLDPRQIAAFKRGLVENGLFEGRNISVEFRWAEGQLDQLPRLAAELVQLDLEAIVTAGPQAVRALIAATKKTPVVMAIVSDPVGDGLVESLARPGGNVTGLSMSNTDLESKRIEILKEAVPSLTRLMILHDP